ncbi:MAG: hypothetical protein DWQ30_23665 [Acidobacteria bacterium]|nr:MAG: hypothetical protein DWQ30_23665 [Acidobacteriota bacterium]
MSDQERRKDREATREGKSYRVIVVEPEGVRDADEDEGPSKRRKSARRAENAVIRAAETSVQALADGIGAYREEREKAREEDRDDRIEEVAIHLAEGVAKSVETASQVPRDLARDMPRDEVRRAIRRGTKAFRKATRR